MRFVKKIISTVLAISTLPFISPYCTAADEFDSLRQRRVEYLTGGNYPTSGELYTGYIKGKIDSIASNGKKWQDSIASDPIKTGYLWSDLVMGDTNNEYTRKASPVSKTFSRIKDMAMAYKTNGSSLKGNTALKNDIISALEYMYNYKYNENTPRTNRNLSPKNPDENWYYWEIGAPGSIVDTLALMYEELDGALINNLLKAIDKQVPEIGASATGANRLDFSLHMIIGGIVEKSEKRLRYGIEAIDVEMRYSTTDDGFYEDGTFIQHHNHPYNGAYGLTALGSLSEILYLFESSSFMPDRDVYSNIYRWVYDSFEPLCYEGRMMDSVGGRNISRSGSGYGLLDTLVLLSGFAPKKDADYYKKLIKRYAQNNKNINPYSGSVFTAVRLYPILKDESIPTAEDKSFYKNFGSGDRAVMMREGYALNISMYSDRIKNYESINGENLKGWHTASGAVYLYNDDLKHYHENYWPTVDSYRIPGTTVVKNSTEPAGTLGALAGGVELDGFYGVNAMLYDAPNDADGVKKHDLTAKKAWFALDDELVCLGSGITSNTAADDIETVVENRKVNYFTQDLVVDGTKTTTTEGWKETFSDVKWIYLRGNSKSTVNTHNTHIGYYFPDGERITAKREKRSGRWRDIGTGSTTTVSNNYMSLGIEQGKLVKNGDYAYAILPGKTSAEVKTYAGAPGFRIVSNTADFQAVEMTDNAVMGAVVWNSGEHRLGDTILKTPMIMMYKEEDGIIEISVSDPTQKGKIIRLTLDRPVKNVISQDSGVSVYNADNKAEIVVNTTGSLGKTYHIKLSENEVEGAPELPSAPDVTALSPTALELRFEMNDGFSYQAVYSEALDGEYIPVEEFDGKSPFIHRNLKPGNTYYYRLAAKNDKAVSAYSEAVNITLPAIPKTEICDINESFDAMNYGPLDWQNGWEVTKVNPNDYADVISDSGGKAVELYSDSASSSVDISRRIPAKTGRVVAECDFKIYDSNWKNLIILYDGDTIAVQVYANSCELWTYNGSAWDTKCTLTDSRLEIGKTYHLVVSADINSDTFSVFLDGKRLYMTNGKNMTFRNKVAEIDGFKAGLSGVNARVMLDNIKVHTGAVLLSSSNGEAKVLNPHQADIYADFYITAFQNDKLVRVLKPQKITLPAGEITTIKTAGTDCFLWERDTINPLTEKIIPN